MSNRHIAHGPIVAQLCGWVWQLVLTHCTLCCVVTANVNIAKPSTRMSLEVFMTCREFVGA